MKPTHQFIALITILAVFGIGFDKVVTQHQFDGYKQQNSFNFDSLNKRVKEIEKYNLADLEKAVDQMGCDLLLTMIHEKRADQSRLTSMEETNLMGKNMMDPIPYQRYIEGQIINLGSEIRMLELKIEKSHC
jgi:hypothetical protein